MDDLDRWKILANLLFSMKTLIEAALGVIQEKIKAIQEKEPARGQQDGDDVLRRVQEAAGRVSKTFGGRVHPAASPESAKGSDASPTGTSTSGRE